MHNLKLEIYTLWYHIVSVTKFFTIKQIIEYLMVVLTMKCCNTEAYSEPCQTSKIERFAKVVNGL